MSALTRHNVSTSGRGTTPLVFAHGFGCDQRMWRFITPAFERDYRIVLFDHIGHGGAVTAGYDPARYADLSGYAADVYEICRELDIRAGAFVGHSVSAMIGVLVANMAPRCSSSWC
jgi:sigma-B regulation protein RsbQ